MNSIILFAKLLLLAFVDEHDNVVVRLFGATRNGNSVCALVHGFVPYFYVEINEKFAPEYIERAKTVLNKQIKVTFALQFAFCIPEINEKYSCRKIRSVTKLDFDIAHGF